MPNPPSSDDATTEVMALAEKALDLAIRAGRETGYGSRVCHNAALRTVQQMFNAHGPQSISKSILVWCDAFIFHAFGETETDFGFYPNADVDREGVTKPETLWAMRLLEARVKGDRDAFSNVSEELLAWPDEVVHGRYLEELLMMIGATIAATPAGYAKAAAK